MSFLDKFVNNAKDERNPTSLKKKKPHNSNIIE